MTNVLIKEGNLDRDRHTQRRQVKRHRRKIAIYKARNASSYQRLGSLE